jgi:hypothetical protein
MKIVGLERVLYEQDEKIEYGGFLDGDFNSNASTQSWGDFFRIWSTFGGAAAVATELSSWHGERELKEYDRPYGPYSGENIKLPLPENYEVSFIKSGMKSSDFLDNVSSDEYGEYYNYKQGSQTLKFYLPSAEFFSTYYANMPYKFKTETGDVYSLVLTLKSSRTSTELQLGADSSEDDMTISMKNLAPSKGNGWGFLEPPDLSGRQFEYYRRIGGLFEAYNLDVVNQSVKSSFQLWWDQWGVVSQIVASIALAAFTGGLSAALEGIFLSLAEAEALAAGGAGVFQSCYTFLTTAGAFNTSRSTVMAMFMLETTVNGTAAYIDYKFNNKFGAVLGIAFCFFPVIASYGKLGKWIKGSYSESATQSIIQKLGRAGLSENSTQEELYKFIIDLTAEEKLMWTQAMKLFSKEEGKAAFESTLKEVFEKAAKDGETPTKFLRWWKGGGAGSEAVKTLLAAGIYFVDVSKWYFIIEAIKNKKNDKRDVDQIFGDAQKNADGVKEKFKTSEESTFIPISKTNDIIKSHIDSKNERKGGELIYDLSLDGDKTFFLDLVANQKRKSLEVNVKNSEKALNATYQEINELWNMCKEINNYADKPITQKELLTWIEPEDVDDTVLQFFAQNDSDLMSNQLKHMVNKNKCLATNFKYLDGIPLVDGYILNFEVTKEINVKYNNKQNTLTLKQGDTVWLFDNGTLTYNDKDYTSFSCN